MLIDDLFGVDAQARELNLDTPRAMRCVWSGPSHWWRSSAGRSRQPRRCLPSSALESGELLRSRSGEAHRFLEYPELEFEQQLGRELDAPVALAGIMFSPGLMQWTVFGLRASQAA